MAIEVFNRYEVKYLLNKTQYENILSAVPEYMTSDKYNKNNTFTLSVIFIWTAMKITLSVGQ